ncbi:MAG: restriction endonuclease subunit S, partial [Desulfosarcina sp.]|nr:restriction endonuclease subunit S [Desulfobacterales bacterium]
CIPKYLYSLFDSSMGKRQAIEFAKKAVNQVSINASEIKKMEFLIPSLAEQRAIAQILSTADDEIKILEQKRSAIEKQKRGLMQKLLTGEIRVNR